MRPPPSPHSIRRDRRDPLPRPVRPPPVWRLAILLAIVIGAIVYLLSRAGGS
jgi:hypothetical protein